MIGFLISGKSMAWSGVLWQNPIASDVSEYL